MWGIVLTLAGAIFRTLFTRWLAKKEARDAVESKQHEAEVMEAPASAKPDVVDRLRNQQQ